MAERESVASTGPVADMPEAEIEGLRSDLQVLLACTIDRGELKPLATFDRDFAGDGVIFHGYEVYPRGGGLYEVGVTVTFGGSRECPPDADYSALDGTDTLPVNRLMAAGMIAHGIIDQRLESLCDVFGVDAEDPPDLFEEP